MTAGAETMTQRQYEQALANVRRYLPRSLFDARTGGRIVRSAARTLRRREQAENAWRRAASPSWRELVRVESVRGDTVLLLAANPRVALAVRAQIGRVQRAFTSHVPGVRRVWVLLPEELETLDQPEPGTDEAELDG